MVRSSASVLLVGVTGYCTASRLLEVYFLLCFLLGLVRSRGVLEMTIIGRSVECHWASQLLDNILDVHLFLHCRSFLCALRCRLMVDFFFFFNFLLICWLKER